MDSVKIKLENIEKDRKKSEFILRSFVEMSNRKEKELLNDLSNKLKIIDNN